MTYDELFEHFGRHQGKIARAVALSQPSVHFWQKNGIPLLRQQEIAMLTGGKLKADVAHAPTRERKRYQKVLAMSRRLA